MKYLEIESFFGIQVTIYKFSRCCCSSSSGGVTLVDRRIVRLSTVYIERRGEDGGCVFEMENKKAFTSGLVCIISGAKEKGCVEVVRIISK